MPRNIRKACCAAFSLALGSGPSSVAAQIDDADRAGAPAETREDRRYGKQLEAPPSPLLFRLPGTGQAAPPQRLTYQYSYSGEAEGTYRRNPDLDRRVLDNVSLVKPQVNGIIVYRPTDSLEATLEMVLEREIPIREPSSVTLPNGTIQFAPEKRRWSLLVDQGFVTFRRPGQPFSLSVGRRNFEDDRHWLYDTSMDMVSAGYRDGNPNDKTNTEFRQTGLQSNESRFAGVALFNIYGEAIETELSNLQVATVGLGFRPDHATSLDFVFHRYRLHKIADENRSWALTALMNQVPGQQSKQVGQAFDIVLGFRNMFGVRRLGLDLRMGWFFPGKAFNRDEGTEEQPGIRRANNAFALVAKFFY